MTRPPDIVKIEGGYVEMPEKFREVARLANQAGLQGFEILDVQYGLDLEAARAKAMEAITNLTALQLPVVVRILYQPRTTEVKP